MSASCSIHNLLWSKCNRQYIQLICIKLINIWIYSGILNCCEILRCHIHLLGIVFIIINTLIREQLFQFCQEIRRICIICCRQIIDSTNNLCHFSEFCCFSCIISIFEIFYFCRNNLTIIIYHKFQLLTLLIDSGSNRIAIRINLGTQRCETISHSSIKCSKTFINALNIQMQLVTNLTYLSSHISKSSIYHRS